MPQLGLTTEEGTISNRLRTEGDSVEAGDVLCEVETDKLTNEVTSECASVLRAIVAPVGDDVPPEAFQGTRPVKSDRRIHVGWQQTAKA